MAITTLADVKILGKLYTVLGEGEPTTSTSGTVGDIYVDIDEESATYGNTYILVDESGGVYTWDQESTDDVEIGRYMKRAEQDYRKIRGKEFDIEDDVTIYPDGADLVAAEMILYLMGITEGRGKDSDSLGDRSQSYEKKIAGYPVSIVGQIDRYVGIA